MKRTTRKRLQALPPLLIQHREALLALAERRGLRNVRVFGSMARGDDRSDSDVDLLVDAPPGTSALALCGLSIDAEALLQKPVDVVTEGFLYPPMRERVIDEAVPL
ncbi:MAG: nucleotidyltransferase family protein [Gammaproteobacteria bacterium]|nr:nucleotidyltransferase family protein [Gammaproteobacteria bacterium]